MAGCIKTAAVYLKFPRIIEGEDMTKTFNDILNGIAYGMAVMIGFVVFVALSVGVPMLIFIHSDMPWWLKALAVSMWVGGVAGGTSPLLELRRATPQAPSPTVPPSFNEWKSDQQKHDV